MVDFSSVPSVAVTFFAEVKDLAGLHAAARARAEQLKVSRATLDEISGMQEGYSAKLLAPTPLKHFGPVSFVPMLRALGLKLIVVDDPQAFEEGATRLTPKTPGCDRHPASDVAHVNQAPQLIRIINAEMGRRRAAQMNSRRTAAERSEGARRAANARWKRVSGA